MKHFADIERLAMVGDNRWEEGMSAFCRPFTGAHIRYFDRANTAEAHTWLESEQRTGSQRPASQRRRENVTQCEWPHRLCNPCHRW